MNDRPQRKRDVRQAFNRAAPTYDQAAAVQRDVCARLAGLARANAPIEPVTRVLDGGCGTGAAVEFLQRQFPAANLLALDFAPAMLQGLRARHGAGIVPVCADLEALPLATASIDAFWSSLALQWCAPAPALAEIARVLRPGGVAWIATLGPRTLHELREAFAQIDDASHVIDFLPADNWIDAARAAGLIPLAQDLAPAYALAPDLRGLLRDIKAIGAHHVGDTRRKQPLGRSAWRTLEAHYEAHRRPDGQLPATYDLILLALQKPRHAY